VNRADVQSLFDWLYWVNHRLLDAAEALDDAAFRAPSKVTTRSLRETFVHELDVEWSWRENLRGKALEEWGPDEELKPEDFPDLRSLRDRWLRDEDEMRSWLDSLSDRDVAGLAASAFTDDRRPLWQYLMHIVSHAAQQQADAATLLTLAGRSPGEIGYLEYLRIGVGAAVRRPVQGGST
jgi:uncharacterized damage-inducible protein DinB